MSKIKFKINFILLLSIIITGFSWSNLAFAGMKDRIKGYAWSENIGWISFNNCQTDKVSECSEFDYGVGVLPPAGGSNKSYLTGYAWSDNIGWISFDYCETASNCEQPYLNTTDNKFYGDAVALAGIQGNTSGKLELINGANKDVDGWSGKISLEGTAYGAIKDINEIKGYSWGDQVIGWISHNCINNNTCANTVYKTTIDAFSFNFTASHGLSVDDLVDYGSPVNLIWTTIGDNVSKCVPKCIDNCRNSVETAWKDKGNLSASGNYATENLTDGTDHKYYFRLTCEDNLTPQNSITRDLTINVKPPRPVIVSFTVDDDNITSGTNTILRWDIEHIDHCDMYKTDISHGKILFTTFYDDGNISTGNLTEDTQFTIDYCEPESSSVYGSNDVVGNKNILVYIEDLRINFSVVNTNIQFNDQFKLLWDTEFAYKGCTVSSTPELQGTFGAPYDKNNKKPFSGQILPSGNNPGPYADDNSYFISEPQNDKSKKSYQISITCTDSNNYSETENINLQIGINPNFEEK